MEQVSQRRGEQLGVRPSPGLGLSRSAPQDRVYLESRESGRVVSAEHIGAHEFVTELGVPRGVIDLKQSGGRYVHP